MLNYSNLLSKLSGRERYALLERNLQNVLHMAMFNDAGSYCEKCTGECRSLAELHEQYEHVHQIVGNMVNGKHDSIMKHPARVEAIVTLYTNLGNHMTFTTKDEKVQDELYEKLVDSIQPAIDACLDTMLEYDEEAAA